MPFLAPYIGWGTNVLEVVVGIIFVYHGWRKIVSPVAAGRIFKKGKNAGLLFGLIEVLAGVMIASGTGTFTGTVLVSLIMLGALYSKLFRWKTTFSTDTEGWQFDLLILAAALTLMLG